MKTQRFNGVSCRKGTRRGGKPGTGMEKGKGRGGKFEIQSKNPGLREKSFPKKILREVKKYGPQ